MCLDVNSSFVIVWADLPTCYCIVVHIYIVMLYIAVPIVVIESQKVYLVFEVTLREMLNDW